MVLLSVASKQVFLLELSVPWEERIEETNERKRAKYAAGGAVPRQRVESEV